MTTLEAASEFRCRERFEVILPSWLGSLKKKKKKGSKSGLQDARKTIDLS